nr:probable protein S-acyltransferase 7 [Tanacetum cinerariifolium]
VLVLLLLTSGRDPGIIPRNAHPPEPEGFDGNTEDLPAAHTVLSATIALNDLIIIALGLGNV